MLGGSMPDIWPDIWGNMGYPPLMLLSMGLPGSPLKLALEGACFFWVSVTDRGVGLLPTCEPYTGFWREWWDRWWEGMSP